MSLQFTVYSLQLKKSAFRIFLFFIFCLLSSVNGFAQDEKEPVTVDGDKLEYAQTRQEVTATGNVVVTYKDTKLICDKIIVNLLTKDCLAQGRVKLVDPRGEVLAESMLYNLQSKTGELLEARIVSEPIFGRGKKIERVSEKEYVTHEGYATTCSYDKPHYRMFARSIRFYPQDKVKAKDIMLYLGEIPVFYFPGFTHSLKDTFSPVQLQPGKNKDWGYYVLTAWRFNITDNLKGRLLFDTRSRLGQSEGVGLNYNDTGFGKGDFKFYYTNEKPHDKPADNSDEFERYLVRWRHIWQIDEDNRFVAEFYKIKDSKINHDSSANFLKDYFFREFEKDQQPKTYALFNHIFDDASLNFLLQKRTTDFFQQIEKLPEISFDMPAYQLGLTPFYFKTDTTFSNLMNRGVSTITNDDLITRFDTYNQFFLPQKISFLRVNPYAGLRETVYSRDINDKSIGPRSSFYGGVEMSTKLFRAFGDKMRHVLNPAVRYAYNSPPTVGRSRLVPFDSIDTLEASSAFEMELNNILQMKRDGRTVNAALFRVTTEYNMRRKQLTGKGFGDINYDLELNPLDWLRFETDAKYGAKEGYFKEVNLDLSTELGPDRSFGIGQRYERGGGKQLTTQFNWRINPKWKFSIYERYQFADIRRKGLVEQEYTISRDLHCWEFDMTFNISKEHGSTIWFIFRLKAFPEYEFDFSQTYNKPKTATTSESP